MKKRLVWCVSLNVFVAFFGSLAARPMHAQESSKAALHTSDTVAEVELFEAMRSKQIEVKVIPLGSHSANIVLKNNTKAPVLVQLPRVFAAVPVLGQIGGGQFGGGQFGGGQLGGGGLGGGGLGGGIGGGLGQGGGGGQGLGGGFGGGGVGGGLGGGGLGGGGLGGGGLGGGGQFGGGQLGGMFRVEADRPAKLSVATVCLEYGKPDPNPRMKYTIAPLEQLNDDPKVAELCKLLADGKVKQNTAQAAAWNIANGISWDELAKKNRRESHIAGNERYFSFDELRAALSLTGYCRAATEKLVIYDRGSNEERSLSDQ